MQKFLWALFLLASPAFALELHMPLDCDYGTNCFIQNYVDADPTPSYQDYSCGSLSYNNHKGTDFRLPDYVTMEKGVDIIAAAPGRVIGMRDGMPEENRAIIKDRECGNGVLIDHGDGWQTQYCHMRKGSIAVKRGEMVKTGQKLGLVGLSGDTVFPHVHLEVRKDGMPIDPFSGETMGVPCKTAKGKPLWSPDTLAKLQYIPTALLNAGFADAPLKPDEARHGKATSLNFPTSAPMLLLWADIMGIQVGDMLTFEIRTPQGEVLNSYSKNFIEPLALQFTFAGKKRGDLPAWPAGVYTGRIMLKRQNAIVVDKTIELTIQ